MKEKLSNYMRSCKMAFIKSVIGRKDHDNPLLLNIKAMGYSCFKVCGTYENEKQERIAVINTYHSPKFKEETTALAEKYNKDIFFTKAGESKAGEVLSQLLNGFVIESVSEKIEPNIKWMSQYNMYKNAYDSNF